MISRIHTILLNKWQDSLATYNITIIVYSELRLFLGFSQIPLRCLKAWNTSNEAFPWKKHLHFWNLTSLYCSQVAVSQYFRWLLRFRMEKKKVPICSMFLFHMSCTHRGTHIRKAGRILPSTTNWRGLLAECSQTKDPHIFHKELHRCLFLRRSAFSLLPECRPGDAFAFQ